MAKKKSNAVAKTAVRKVSKAVRKASKNVKRIRPKKVGRPINWEKAYKSYVKKIHAWERRLNHRDEIKLDILSKREFKRLAAETRLAATGKMSVARATSDIASRQAIGLSSAQIGAMARAMGISTTKAAMILSNQSSGASLEDVEGDIGGYQPTLRDTLLNEFINGEISLNDYYRILKESGMSKKEAGAVISNDVYGSPI